MLSGAATVRCRGWGLSDKKNVHVHAIRWVADADRYGNCAVQNLEAGAFETSFVPNGAASATRAADVVTCTGAAFSQWFNGSEGTFVVEAVMPNSTVGSTNIMNIIEPGRVWKRVD